MTSQAAVYRGPVFFSYANPRAFSGQKEATEIVCRGLGERGWDCRLLPLPYHDRIGRWATLRFGWELLRAWLSCFRLLASPGGSLCANLGQTRFAFLRDAVPLLLARLSCGRERIIASLHGSLFMQWPDQSINARLFRTLLRQAGLVTVLGERQRARLLALGLEPDRVAVVVNTCALPALSAAELAAKLSRTPGGNQPLRLLHLGSLLVAKGFPAYLEALTLLAARPGPPLEAVLCGRMVAGGVQEKFADDAAAEAWIEEQLVALNAGGRVRARWVHGAVGGEKLTLFRDADIFVLPTRYAVEAQPIVLLEAMASGCAIVTTGIGEIPAILDAQCALFLDDGSAAKVASAVERLALDSALRGRLARAAHQRFWECYQTGRHLDGWEARRRRPGHRRLSG